MLRMLLFAFAILAATSRAVGAPEVEVLQTPRATGDLNADGRAEDALVITLRPAAASADVFVAVFERRPGGGRTLLGTVRLEPGARVDRLRLLPGRLSVAYRRHYPVDPVCCPRRETVRSYALAHGVLQGGDHRPPPGAWHRAAVEALAR